ncbi:MAG: M50 family metallopeptidase, partial [Deltaproteobacteria bacterium]|nr:M50 family metallopeptidase [Kofleriaceae bacterium]
YSASVTSALYVTPGLQFIARPLLYLSTLVHEMGHGVGALLGGGDWIDFRLFADGSGYATTATVRGDDFGRALTCAAGLVGPAVAAAVFMVMGLRARLARWALAATGAFFAVSLVLWVRGSFGVAFVAIVAAACLGIAWKASDEVSRVSLLFLATQLALSVYSRGDYLFEDYVDGQMSGGERVASDTQSMADALGMTYWFWGLVCAAFSAAVLVFAVWLYVRPPRAPRLDT